MSAPARRSCMCGGLRSLVVASMVGWILIPSLVQAQPNPARPPAPAGRGRRAAQVRVVQQLPPPNTAGGISVEQALVSQDLSAEMTTQPLCWREIGQLVWAAATGAALVQPATQAEAAAGLQILVVGVDGMYRYVPLTHALEQVSPQPMLAALGLAVIPQQPAAGCALLVTTASRTRQRSDTPWRRVQYLETGQRVQNLRLQAAGLGLAMAVPQQFDAAAMAKALALPRDTEILCILFVGYRPGQTGTAVGLPWSVPGQAQAPKRVALVVASSGFQDEELSGVSGVLTSAGVQTILVSSRAGPVTGSSGASAQALVPLGQLRVDDVDAVVFIGGVGANEYLNNPTAHTVARDTLGRGKILGAICLAPSILAHAGLLNGVKVTAFETERERLVGAGAIFTGNPVERDRQIITANSPGASALFGQAILGALQGR